ncbi:MAG TPA: hypothetical protein VH589_04965 [Trebonia sp.]|jgi:hypothetical protein
MDLTRGLEDLVAVMLVAALAPLIVAALPGPRIPQVVIFLIGGVIIGPHGLGFAESSSIQLLSNVGLGRSGWHSPPRLSARSCPSCGTTACSPASSAATCSRPVPRASCSRS